MLRYRAIAYAREVVAYEKRGVLLLCTCEAVEAQWE
jgi:hypothetical protein